MRFGLIHRIMTDSLAALGILALITSGKLHPIVSGVVVVGLLIGIFFPEGWRQHASTQLAGVVGPLVVLSIQLLRLFFGGDPIPIVVEFAALLQVVRLATRRGAAHDHQVILLSLLHLIAATVLGGGLTYAAALVGFLVFTPGALVLSHLRREVEGNYRQGARDRTGMPVDVPRILRSRRVVGRGFLLFTCSLSLPVFVFSGLLFMIFPRVGFAWISIPPIAPSRMVGFSDRVDLGGVGTIRSDPTLVLRVRPDDLTETTEPRRRRNFYLRGAVFDTYNGRSWSRNGVASSRPREVGNQVILRRRPRDTDQILEIDLNRIDPPVVFIPGEAVALDILSGNRRLHQFSSIVSTDARGQLQYSALEQEGLRYRAYLPKKGIVVPEFESHFELQRYLRLPPELSPRVRQLAHELTKGISSPLQIAQALEEALRIGYQYDLGSPSGAAKDPLEHFLFESKRGHCEYYSTAMAMLLRVRGVPSRNVTGFVGGTYNRFGSFYAVRQGDAHSWVEAYLPERGWIRFDPTPPSSAAPHAMREGVAAFVREFFEAASQGWRKNVVDFDMENQLEIMNEVKKFFRQISPETTSVLSKKWSLRRVGIPSIGVLILLGGAVVLWRRRRRSSGAKVRDISPSVARSIQLYQGLEKCMRYQGVPRPLSVPPLTFAKTLCASGNPLGEEVLALTEIYARSRYAGERLTEHQVDDFRRRVASLRRVEFSSLALAHSAETEQV